MKAGRGQRLGQVRAPWRAASARRLIELGRGTARRRRCRSGDGTGRATCSSWKAMSGAQRASGRRATLLHAWVNGGRRCVVVAERPSGFRCMRGGAEAFMAGWGLSVVAAGGGATTVQQRQRQHSCSALQAVARSRGKGGREKGRGRERREVNVFDSRFSQNFPWKLKKV